MKKIFKIMIVEKLFLSIKISTISLILLLISSSAFSQDANTVTGKVVNEKNEPIIGAIVELKGGGAGGATDENGNYSISLPDLNGTLVFNYTGFKKKSVPVNGQTTVDVTLVEDAEALSQVVVIGYGTKKRSDLTGSIASISQKDIKALPVANPVQAMQGRIAGVSISGTGSPGSTPSVLIRGVGSIQNSTEPLYVIDGFPANDATAINNINPNDIESIDVLKDASAAAIYGSRASNGVIMITTKRGTSGKPKVNFDTYYGVQSVYKKQDLLNSEQYVQLNTEQKTNAGATQNIQSNLALQNNTNWQDEVFTTAPIYTANLSVSGGSKNSNFALSGGYFKQDGVVITTGLERYSFRANSDFTIGKFKIGESFTGSLAKTTGSSANYAIAQSLKLAPTVPIYNTTNDPAIIGPYGGPLIPLSGSNDAGNPVGFLESADNQGRRFRALGNIYGEFAILKFLKWRTSLGADIIHSDGYSFRIPYVTGNTIGGGVSSLRTYNANMGFQDSWTVDHTLNFSKVFADKHDISFLLGYSDQKFNNNSISGGTYGFPDDDLRGFGIGGTINDPTSGSPASYALRSQFGRLSYIFNDRYLITATVRRDGSSRFSEDNRYGIFPSLAAAWKIKNEKFMENLAIISDLKLRAGWGETGNQNVGLNYQPYVSPVNLNIPYILGTSQTVSQGSAPTFLGNPLLKWESMIQTNIGFDVSVLQSKIILNVDYFVKTNKNLLLNVPLPSSTGFTVAPPLFGFADRNTGSLRNSGIEAALTYRKAEGDFNYSISGNFTYLKNRIITLGERKDPVFSGAVSSGGVSSNAQISDVGYAVGSFYGFVTDGLFQSQEEVDNHAFQSTATKAGDIRFRDLNGDGKITDDDRTVIGSPIPKFLFGLNGSASYKGFDASIFFQGNTGNKLYNQNRLFLEGLSDDFNKNQEIYENYWKADRPTNDARYPRAIAGDPNQNNRVSDRFLESGSYIRLKNLQIGYSLPKTLLEKTNSVSSVRFYISATNLLTLTKYSGFDPEFSNSNTSGSNLGSGIDAGVYPNVRTMLVGLQVGF